MHVLPCHAPQMHIAFQVYDLVDKHIRELDEDLKGFASEVDNEAQSLGLGEQETACDRLGLQGGARVRGASAAAAAAAATSQQGRQKRKTADRRKGTDAGAGCRCRCAKFLVAEDTLVFEPCCTFFPAVKLSHKPRLCLDDWQSMAVMQQNSRSSAGCFTPAWRSCQPQPLQWLLETGS